MIKSSKRIAMLYFCIGVIWIYTSDMFFDIVLTSLSKSQINFFNTLKGIGFVALTAFLLYKLIGKYYKTLKRSEEEYRAMFDCNPNPMWIYDTETLAFLRVNHAAVSKYGFSQAEFLKMKAIDIRPEEEVEKFTNYISNNNHVIGNSGIWTHRLKNTSLIKIQAFSYDIIYNNKNAKLILAVDITEKVKYEQKLKEQQEILELTVRELRLNKEKITSTQEIAKIGGWTYALDNDSFDFTSQFYELLRIPREYRNLNTIADFEKFVCEEDISKLRDFMSNFKNGDKEGECILRVIDKDNWRFIKFGALLTSSNPGQSILEGFVQDITRLELKDQLIKVTLERFEQLAITTNDALYEWDYAQNEIRWTGNVSVLIGNVDKATIDQEWWKERIHPNDYEKNHNLLLAAIDSKQESLKREYRFKTENGDYKQLYDQSIIRYGNNHKVLKIIGSLHDIEEITKVSRENKRLGEIVNKVKNLIVITNKYGLIEWVNGAFIEKMGYSWNEIVGKKPWELLKYPNSSEDSVMFIKEAVDRKEFFNVEVENITKNGDHCWFQIDGSPIYGDKNECLGYIAIESDITERKNKEEKIKQQNKLLKEAAWINSHQVRKPLASILGLIQLMQLADNVKETEEYLSLLEICSNELDVIIKKSVSLADFKE